MQGQPTSVEQVGADALVRPSASRRQGTPAGKSATPVLTFEQVGADALVRPSANRRRQVFGLYRSLAPVFAPARSLRLRASRSAQDDETKYRSALFYNVIFVSTVVADLPTAARRSLPRDFSTTLEMTGRGSVPLGWRADEGVRPYLFYQK